MEAEQRRWAWSEIDLGAIATNVRTLKSRLQPGVLFMAVVKADGYGHGGHEVGRAALSGGADRLGVATLDEACRLRAAGITAPVQMLSEAPPTAAPTIVDRGIVPAIFSRAFAEALSAAASEAGAVVPFHLKLDTGMNRIGVRAEDAVEFLTSLRGLPGLRLEGVFTHFATADVPGDWDFDRQLERFGAAITALRDAGIDPGIVHAANSPATILHPEVHFDMVRCGIAIYGLHPADTTHGVIELVPAMSIKARISRVSRLGMGEGVSYGMTWRAPAPTTIATLPLGYADGVRRNLSNQMKVLIGGVACNQVGRVCMDQLMVEVPRGLEVAAGDEAVLVGHQGSATITIEEQAALAGTIDYEIACGYGARLTRVYTAS